MKAVRRAARRPRRVERSTATPVATLTAAVRRECHHAHTTHQHGTRGAYLQDVCRCQWCRLANRAAQQNRRRAIAYGRWEPFVDARPIRAHVVALQGAGVSLTRIAALSGVSRGALQALLYGKPVMGRPPNSKLHAATARRILTVQATARVRPDHAVLTDDRGAIRRLQGLVSVGWSVRRLAQALNSSHSTVSRILNGGPVTVSMDRRIRAVFVEFGDQPAPAATAGERASAEGARRYARVRRWVAAGAWHNIDIDEGCAVADDGEWVTDQVAVDRAVVGLPTPLTAAEMQLAVEELTRRGVSVRKIAERLRRHPRTVRRYRTHRRAA